MRSSLSLVFLLVLHLLLRGAQGARLGKFAIKSTTSQTTIVDNETAVKKFNDQNTMSDKKEIEGLSCNDDEDHCLSKGKNRKLITSTTMPTSPAKSIQENFDKGREKMGIKRNDKAQKLSSSSSIYHNPSTGFDLDKHKEIAPAEYEDAMDMTVMDYSPAKRKPPIHN